MKSTNHKSFSMETLDMTTPLCIFFFFLHSFIIFVAGQTEPSYVPRDNIVLDCGSDSDNTIQGRTWKAETRSKLLLFEQNNASVASPAVGYPRTVNAVPYRTARLSCSQFSYGFPVTAGPKFVRLYFYPASYPNFTSSAALFSVKAGRFTLLRNFSTAHHAQALGLEAIYKEFCVNVENDQRLSITFSPAPGIPDAYAFVNGIEVVSMPDDLYYSGEADPGVNFVGQINPLPIDRTRALEMMYRINMGGNSLSAMRDSGLYRSWSMDNDYLTNAQPSALPFNNTIQLVYNNRTRFAAPGQVYRTARTMGLNKTVNENYNLTWEFPVDSSFTYFVRLHFCEFQPLILEQGDRVFEIYMANQTAEDHADVIEWAGRYGIPVFRDYAVMIGAKGSEKFQNISIALHPLPERETSYSDAILNGLEIFKLSESDNLAGPNPDPLPIRPPTGVANVPISSKSKSNRITIVTSVVGSVSAIILLSLLVFFILHRRKKAKDSCDGASFLTTSAKSTKSGRSSLPSDLCHHFSLGEIKAATNNFDSVFIIGVGGFGNVYKGFIDRGTKPVAIKRLNPGSQQGADEFKTEIEMLSQLRHINLVSLIGYCYEDGEMILVYDYMAHGTLRDHLYKTDNPPLSWNQRLEICIGSARGLQYLHSEVKKTVIHRDVKTTNILLDQNWVAKISDFGLSKIGPTSMSKGHVSTVVKGSFGYLDPEYCRLGQLTDKSDVYSFGVVLCEILCAKPPVIKLNLQEPASLAEHFRVRYREGMLNEIIDPYLDGKIAPECVKRFTEIAASCLLDRGIDRPSMADVVWELEFALQLQKSAEEKIEFGEAQTLVDTSDERAIKDHPTASSDDLFSNSSSMVIVSRMTT
uniref:Kinase n=1 Tax=Rhizophora mucronata TaxID=61149 RepID=A0A2P2MV55_RHIMU